MSDFADLDAERALLSSVILAGDADPSRIVLLTGSAYSRLGAVVRAEDFADVRHAAVWSAMGDLVTQGHGNGAVSIRPALRAAGNAARINGTFLAGLTVAAQSYANADALACIVAAHASRRRAIAAADAHRTRLRDGEDIAASVATMEAESRDGVTGPRDISAHAAIEEAWDEVCEDRGVLARWGVSILDDGDATRAGVLGGLFAGQLTVLGAVPGGGKTALAITTTVATAEKGGRVLFGALEMPRTDVAWRMAAGYCRHAPPSVDRIRARTLTDDEVKDLQQSSAIVARLAVLIEDRDLTVNAFCALARAEHSRSPLALIVVDYLHLFSRDAGDERLRGDEVIRRQVYALKGLAKALRVPVLVLVQFNRVGGKSERPRMFDALGGSGIEQGADNVLILVPDESQRSAAQGRVMAFVDKRRGGAPCTEGVAIHFDRARQRFCDAPEWDAPHAAAGYTPDEDFA